MTKRIYHSVSAILLAAVLFCLAFVPDIPVCAETVASFAPHLVTGEADADWSAATVTQLTYKGRTYVRLDIPEDGCLYLSMDATSADFIHLEFYSDINAQPEVSCTCRCTADQGNSGTIRQYLPKGTYQLCIYGQLSTSNPLEIRSLLYRSNGIILNSGDSAVAYCDGAHDSYYTYTAPANGYITLTEKTLVGNGVPPLTGLCDSNGEALTERMHIHTSQDKIAYAVKKNTTYKIWVGASDNTQQHFYRLKLKFKKQADKSGAKKAKAKKVEFGNKVKGTVFAEDELEKADWYKFTNEKKQKVSLECVGSITSGSMIFNIYNSADEKIGECQVVAGVDQSQSYITTSGNDAELLEAGTYYLKITKSRKTAAGIYSFVLHPLG